MPPLEILRYPHPLLKAVCRKVDEVDSSVKDLVRDLVDTMRASPGVGLAAPQVGRFLRVIVVDVTPKNPGHGLVVLINPEIIESKRPKIVREGCLSVPQYTANVRRFEEVVVRGLDADGKNVEIASKGFEAVALQHEIDHLDGILFLDRIANMKRDLFRRKGF